MSRKPIELPPEVAHRFVEDMRAFFAAKGHKADEIAARQLHTLREYQRPHEKKLRLTDVKRDVSRDEKSRMTGVAGGNITCAISAGIVARRRPAIREGLSPREPPHAVRQVRR